jgi:hypothetical protein
VPSSISLGISICVHRKQISRQNNANKGRNQTFFRLDDGGVCSWRPVRAFVAPSRSLSSIRCARTLFGNEQSERNTLPSVYRRKYLQIMENIKECFESIYFLFVGRRAAFVTFFLYQNPKLPHAQIDGNISYYATFSTIHELYCFTPSRIHSSPHKN